MVTGRHGANVEQGQCHLKFLSFPGLNMRGGSSRVTCMSRLMVQPLLPRFLTHQWRLANGTAVQRRAHEGAQRPRRPSDCNGGLAAAARLQGFRHALGEIFVVLLEGADERRLKVEVGDEAPREVADATYPV